MVPKLLQAINQQFDEKTRNSPKLKAALKAMEAKQATYLTANDFAVEIGNILAEVLGANLSAELLPDGKMYFNIANRLLTPTLEKNYELIADFSGDVQALLNEQAGINLQVQQSEFNQDKVDGIVNRLSSEADFDKIKWILDDPVINFSQSVVDDSIDANAKFQSRVGLHPLITRRVFGKGCAWCRNLAGTYEYTEAPHDIYRRHERCRCTVEYDPGSGKRQNVWSKKWHAPTQDDKIESRKHFRPLDKLVQPTRTIQGHNTPPKIAEPLAIIDKINAAGAVKIRSFYDASGLKQWDIHTDTHGNPKTHPFGKHGEHVVEYTWDDEGRLANRIARELTPKERKENRKIL